MKKAFIAIAILPSLPACGEPIRVGALPVQPQFLTCKDEPPVPSAPTPEERDGVIARYIVSLRDAGQHCRDQLAAVRTYVEESK